MPLTIDEIKEVVEVAVSTSSTMSINQVLLLVSITAIASFLGAYLTVKAKNIATKEDISHITTEIEKVKSSYAESLEKTKADLQIKSVLQSAFQTKCLEAVIAVNDLLIEINLYCWKNMAKRDAGEHYVWSHVDDTTPDKHLTYFLVAIDKMKLEHGLYLTDKAKRALLDLSGQISTLVSMEVALSSTEKDPVIEVSASSGYRIGIEAVEKCQSALVNELGINNG
ncbi:hypothetical protein [Agarivorans aestuarii]|uniref:hypothetical protein n=1 Tax=Agarivorans aestuarii TaxID=1563703 RepID=UPI001C823D0A|nr:hypothetical protein [Agarivorans aestuarii]